MSNKGLIDIIEGMLGESIADDINKITKDNVKDGANFKPVAHTSADTQGVLGTTTGAALNAGGDKDVGGSKGDNASDASSDTQGVEGKTTGAALDAGGDKDVGGSKGDNASDASADTQGVEGKHNGAALDAGGDKDVGKLKESEHDDDEDEDEDLEEAKDKGDMDGDGVDEPDDKEYMDNKDAAIKKAMAKEEADLEEKLHGDQHKLDHDHDGDIDAGDMADVRKKGATAHLTKEEADEDDDEAEEMEEAHATANEKQRPDEEKGNNMPKDHKAGDPMGSKTGAALDGGGDKDVGKKPQAAEASADTQGVLGKHKGAALDAGGDKDVGKLKEEAAELDEEFKARAAVIFETAVNEKVATIRETLEAEYALKLEEQTKMLNETVGEIVEEAVAEWLEENKLEIKYSLRTEIAENFIRGLKGLFEDSYIEIPDQDVEVVDELTEAVESYKEEIDVVNAKLAEANKELLAMKRASIVESLSEDLTQVQKIRLEKLSETVEAEEIAEFKSKLAQIKESYFDPKNDTPMMDLSEEVISTEQVETLDENSPVSQYAKFLSKTVLK